MQLNPRQSRDGLSSPSSFSRFDPNVTVAHQVGGERSDIWCFLISSGDVREQIRHFFGIWMADEIVFSFITF